MDYPDYSFDRHYHFVKGLRLHYLDEGPKIVMEKPIQL